MGLMIFDIVVDVEHRFGIEIPDEELSSFRTVGDLYHYVLKCLPPGRNGGCLSQAAFHCLRRGMMQVTGAERRSIGLDSHMEELLTEEKRGGNWRELSEALELELPALWVPHWLESLQVLGFAAFPVAILLGIPIVGGFTDSAIFWSALIAVPATFILVVMGLSFLWPRRRLPEDCQTVRGVTKRLLELNFRRLATLAQGMRKAEVWETLCQIIEELLDIEGAELMEDDDFYHDLGAG